MKHIRIIFCFSCLVGCLVASLFLYQKERMRNEVLLNETHTLAVSLASALQSEEKAQTIARARKFELDHIQQDQLELVRLRNELGLQHHQLSVQLNLDEAAADASATSPSQFKRINPLPPGSYISKESLSYAGFATPEAAIQTVEFARTRGSFEIMTYGMIDIPPIDRSETVVAAQRAIFKMNQEMLGPRFHGMQILARKVVSNDTVDLKVKVDVDPVIAGNVKFEPKQVQVLRVTRQGNEWKLVSNYHGSWADDSTVENLVQ
jgi:hypothetical protein